MTWTKEIAGRLRRTLVRLIASFERPGRERSQVVLVRLFEHAKGSLRAGVTSAVFSPDGTRMATGGAGEKIVNVWNPETGQLVQALGEPQSRRLAIK